jgi:hypothetical protein
MGYEVRLIVGQVCEWDKRQPQSFITMAEIDLCKPGDCHMLNLLVPGHNFPHVAVFGSDGDTQISQDRYGDKLYAIPIETFLPALAKDFTKSKDEYGGVGYRRFLWAYRLLSSMKRHGKHDKIHVVMFGH